MQIMKRMFLALLTLMIMVSGLPIASAATNYVTATKSVNPTTITTEEEAEVTLNITGTPPVNVVKPNDVILIIDRSGSMSQENKMNAAKEAAKNFIDLIDFTKHRVGIVDFSSDAKQFDLTTDGAAAKAYIDTLSAGGATATGDSIDKAMELLANHRPEAQPVIVLMTDGDATVPSGNAYQYALQKANEAKDAGIVFYTIALLLSTDNPDTSGPNLLLKDMATTAHHHHFVLGSVGLAEIYEAIVDEIGLASAYDVVVTDTVAPEFEIVPGSYDNNIPKPQVSGNTLTWNFLELKKDTLSFTYKIRLKQGTAVGTYPISSKSQVTYKDYTGASRYFTIAPPNLTVKYPAPQITSLDEAKGHINGGETVTINGDKFRPGVTVTFGNTSATNIQFISEKQITVTAPPGVQGDTTVTVKNDDGQKATATYHYYAQPEVTSITPNSGPLDGGNTITIYGKYFMPGITVKFGGATGSATLYDGYLKVKVPAGTAPGTVDVELKNPDDTMVTVPAGYTYEAPPVVVPEITSVSPNTGLVSGDEFVYITGKNFTSGLKVYFGANQATVTNFYSATNVKVKTPAAAQPGSVDVTVVNPDGQQATLANGYTYNPLPPAPAPEVTSVSPNTGFLPGGETVYVNGKNFVNGQKVYFGSNEATVLSFLSATQVKVQAPPSSVEGPVDVKVVTPDGQSAILAGGYTYKVDVKPAPTIKTISPNTGLISGGDQVIITGTDIQVGATVTFGTKTVKLSTYFDSTKVKVISPPAATVGPVDVTITNPDGQSFTLSQGFTYTEPQIKINSLSPNSGPITGGTAVYVNGENFDPSVMVTVGGTPVPIATFFDSTRFKIFTPSVASTGPVDIVVTTTTGQTAKATYNYVPPTSLPAPTLTLISPATSPVSGGIYVYIDGTNLNQVKISFGGTVVNPTTIFSSNKIKVRVPAASAPGFVDVKAINAEGTESNIIPFEYK